MNTTPTYSIDGVSFRGLGIYVSGSEGIIGRPRLKSPRKTSWDDYHGEDVDLRHKYYEPREIVLSCFIKADSREDFLSRIARLTEILDKPRLNRLALDLQIGKPLVYEVYAPDEVTITKTWNARDMVGAFKLKLIEPQPKKRVLKFVRSGENSKTCSITTTTPKLLNVYWGDGTSSLDISGTSKSITHDYKTNDTYYIVVTGCIEEIDTFTTNAEIVWINL